MFSPSRLLLKCLKRTGIDEASLRISCGENAEKYGGIFRIGVVAKGDRRIKPWQFTHQCNAGRDVMGQREIVTLNNGNQVFAGQLVIHSHRPLICR